MTPWRSSANWLAIARIVENAERLGLAGNWNQCVRLSRTPFVAIVHQDDVLCPHHLAVHVNAFATDARIGLVATGSAVIDDAAVGAGIGGRSGWIGPHGRNLHALEVVTALGDRESAPVFGGVALRRGTRGRRWLRSGLAVRRGLGLVGFVAAVVVGLVCETTVEMRRHPASETHRFTSGIIDLDETELVLAGLLNELRGQPGVDLRIS